MTMFSKLRRLIVGKVERPEHPLLDARERQLDETLARAYGKTPDEIRREARRRALAIEVSSMRRK